MRSVGIDYRTGIFVDQLARRLEAMAINWDEKGRAEVRGQTWRIFPNPWGGTGHILRTMNRNGYAVDEVFPDLETARRAAEFALLVLESADQVQPEPNDDEDHY
jgi:hypothetical protein